MSTSGFSTAAMTNSECTAMDLTTPIYTTIAQNNIKVVHLPSSVLICTYVSCSLSILGAIIIFVTYCTVQEAKNQTRRLLIYLTIADFLTSSGNLLGALRYSYNDKHHRLHNVTDRELRRHCEHPDDLCAIQSMVTTFSSLASFSWTIIIGLHILLTLVYQTRWCFTTIAKVLAHSASWGIPLVITLVAAFKNVLGEDQYIGSGPWCWIKGCMDNSELILWMTLTGKGWEIMTYIITAFLYIYLKYYMIKKRRRERRPNLRYSHISISLRDEDENYVLLWLVLYILRIWGTARYGILIYKVANGVEMVNNLNHVDMVLMHIQSVGDSAQAFFNCLLFCVKDTAVRHGLLRMLCRRDQDRQLNDYTRL
ncbi:G-protein coupled receptor 157-like [Saccostrea cucullata]|uniref:G-protein coupled receptor 157-like n=1 Tax=Saccostrea cuccullata TaxID=36930 RepID=UPI002ED18CAA